MVKCKIHELNGNDFDADVQRQALGRELFDLVKQRIGLNDEADYFSLSYKIGNEKFWLNMDKPIDKQIKVNPKGPNDFYWEVKFYPPAPEELSEDLTRYQVVLQIRSDINEGVLPASFQSYAILGAYTAQSEFGDYDKATHYNIDYLKQYTFAPSQTEELLMRISDLHRQHRGLTPAEADLYFLENAKKMALYGMKFYPVKDKRKADVLVGIAASGIYIYDRAIRTDGYKWQRMVKISYKKNIFFVKVRAGEFEKTDRIHAFTLPDLKRAKKLWRIAVETHQFFRLNQPMETDNKFGTFGPRKWRMSGRTQAQLKNSATNLNTLGTPRRDFSRSGSYMSQDSFVHGRDYAAGGTLPLQSAGAKEDQMAHYNTYHPGGHRNDNRVILGYDENGKPIYDEYNVNDSTMNRSPDGKLVPPGANSSMFQNAPPLASEDDLIGERGYNAETGAVSDMAATMDRRTNGGPSNNEYESYEDIQREKLVAAASAAPQIPLYPGSVGELPLPYLVSESAGIDPTTGTLDPNIQLSCEERAEKKLAERDTKLKNPLITVDTFADQDDQLLLDAILAVTGLDPRLNVDKIVIKTEQET